mgnify:CR=1 FL=1
MKTQRHDNTPTSTGSTAVLAALVTGLMLVLFGAQGCSFTAGGDWGTDDRGKILFSADAEGMAAISDAMQGLINNGKASPDVDTPHYQMRREQVRAKALKTWSSYSPKGAVRPSGGVQLGREYEGHAQK